MKIYALNITENHPSLKILSRFGETTLVNHWPVSDLKEHGPAMIFAYLNNAEELKTLCHACEERGDWCFVWGSDDVLRAIANYPSCALVDFIGENFNEQEFTIRLLRLVQNDRTARSANFLGVPDEIAEELTKKQLVILKALFDAGEVGLSKQNLAFKIWPKGAGNSAKASGFNVHLLHLRRKINSYGLTVSFDREDRVYRLAAITNAARSKSRRPQSTAIALSH